MSKYTTEVRWTIASRNSRLNEMKKLAEKINKMFGLNIVVSFTQDFREAENEHMKHSEVIS